jgi:hypothetical protein
LTSKAKFDYKKPNVSSDIERWPPPNDPTAFESLCLDLWRDIRQNPSAQKNGLSGQTQAKVDVLKASHHPRRNFWKTIAVCRGFDIVDKSKPA